MPVIIKGVRYNINQNAISVSAVPFMPIIDPNSFNYYKINKALDKQQLANLTDLLVKGDYDVVSTDADGCEGMATFTVAGNVSTNDVVKNENVTIFPNPSVGLFNLNMTNATGEFTISVKNVIGQTVFNQIVVASSSLNTELDLTNVEKGIYFINVANDSFEITEKVIIK